MKPVLSIIIPTHNEELFISQCLANIYAQSFALPYEVIVVDNNCTDNTVALAKKFPVTIVKELRKGPCVTRNTGARSAKSDILVYVDADYNVQKDYLERIYTQFIKEKKLDIIAGAYSFIDGPLLIHRLTRNGIIFGIYFYLIRFIFGFQYLTGGNFAIRKKAYFGIGGFREDYTDVMQGDDIEFAMRLALAGYTSSFNRHITSYTSMRRLKKYNLKDQFMRQYWFFYHVASYRIGLLRYKSLKSILQ